MKAVLREVSPQEIARRKRLGHDRWDEMWEGVLHMSPAPADEHQRMTGELFAFLLALLRGKKRGTLRLGINVFNEAAFEPDYRIPDLTFVAAGRERIMAPDGIRGGGPDAVIEIRSPEDETYEKFPFFAALGVREVVVVDRDTKKPEVYRLAGSQYLAIAADRDGWVVSEILAVPFRLVAGEKPRLIVEDREDASTRVEI
ncbi:MAG: Uma2 family endonuclease [Planctomycetes bacterium]|nr:Uma2 family endonuclease [Planctomycetota bacterium]